MSFAALAWAVAAQPGSPADKLVLLGLADRHNTEHDAAYPSVAWLAEFSGLDRKTVMVALGRLIASGLIADTGNRVGKTKQVVVYRLTMGTVPKVEQSQKRNSSTFSGKESQKRDTDTVKEPVGSEDKSSSPRAWALPVGIDEQVWKDLLRNRKLKKRDNNPTSWKRFQDDLARVSKETGWTPAKLIEHAAAEGWAGIYNPGNRQPIGASAGSRIAGPC